MNRMLHMVFACLVDVSVQLLLVATDFSSSSDTAVPLLATKIPMDSQVHGSSIDDLFSAAANHSTGP